MRWLLDAVIVFTVLEGLGLWLFHRLTGQGLAPGDYALNMLSGLCLMLAVRAAVSDAPWPWIAVCLSASGLAHGWDMRRRWQRQRSPASGISLPS
ncbi:hypothetical protein F9Z44_13320 [Hydrogenophaga sp. PBL-H3]|nr:hypothetical protein F9Z45_13320 [Hydrogenophaga sp. PBL-H3]QHE82853.1 hypothetical protein F9Z44_13320 [Hydrogenophaga sp. PBL-H3]